MEKATAHWAQQGADAITELVTTGKLNFKSLADSIIKDFIRIQVQKLLSSAIGGGDSGGGSRRWGLPTPTRKG